MNSDKIAYLFQVKPETTDDDLPDLGRPDSNAPEIATSADTDAEKQTAAVCEEAVAPNAEPERKLTARERLLKLLGPNCPKLQPTSCQRGMNNRDLTDMSFCITCFLCCDTIKPIL